MPIRENKFAQRVRERQGQQPGAGGAQRRQAAAAARDAQPTLDEHLARLEEDVRRLKVEFDIYFNGGAKRPPYDTKSRVESQIKRLYDERNLTHAQRFLYNTLVARFTSFRELWRRTMQGREEGRDAAAAARLAAYSAQSHHEDRAAEPVTFVCADARADAPTVKGLYEALVAAKKSCGEPVEDFHFERFQRMIAKKTDDLKGNLGCERVRFSVEVRDGRVKFKAKADAE